MLYEALTGRRLFKAKERNETLARVRRAEVPSPRAYRPEISEALEELLFKGLARKASDRFETAGEMLEAVSSLMLREGHRATNNDLASFLKDIVDVAQGGKGVKSEKKSVSQRTLPPTTVVVLSTEAYMPPRSMASPKITLSDLSDRWMKAVIDAKGEVWETHDGSMLVVWQAAMVSETPFAEPSLLHAPSSKSPSEWNTGSVLGFLQGWLELPLRADGLLKAGNLLDHFIWPAG